MEQVHRDLYTLYVTLLTYHWNVAGARFHQLHELFEKQYTKAFKYLDKIAENIRAQDEYIGPNWFFVNTDVEAKNSPEMVVDLIEKFSKLQEDITSIRTYAVSSETILGDLSVWVDKQKWMLKAMSE